MWDFKISAANCAEQLLTLGLPFIQNMYWSTTDLLNFCLW